AAFELALSAYSAGAAPELSYWAACAHARAAELAWRDGEKAVAAASASAHRSASSTTHAADELAERALTRLEGYVGLRLLGLATTGPLPPPADLLESLMFPLVDRN